MSAENLTDHAPERLGREYDAWYTRWMDRLEPGCYWVGQPEHLCFSWSEPDLGLWDAAGDRIREGWSVAPTDRCLNHGRTDDGGGSLPVQIQSTGTGDWRPGADVLWADLDESIVAGNTRTNACYELHGTSAAMWNALIGRETAAGAVDALSEMYDVGRALLETDIQTFVHSLVEHNLLSRTNGPSG